MCLITITYLFALDAKMEIIKRKSNLPQIVISVAIDTENKNLANQIKKLIKKDLQVSGHFETIEYKALESFDIKPKLNKLRTDNIDLFLNLYVKINEIGEVQVFIKLFDINTNDLVLNKGYTSSLISRYPFLSHKISIAINQYLRAPSIKWMDKLVIFSRYKEAGESEIVISDYTLTYQEIVVTGGLNIFPKWADKTQENFYFTSYNSVLPTLKKQSIYTGESENIISSDGMAVCSDISQVDSKIILTLAPNSQPDIYMYDILSNIKTRLTKYKGIDVSGSFVENNKKIVFVSDRVRGPNIFAKTLGQKGIEKLVYHGKNNSQCTTFNNYIVYSSRESANEFNKNAFNLYLISTRSDFIRRLTSTGRNQFPKFSQDGDSILFIKEYKGKNYLGIIRLNYNKSFLFPLKSGKLQSIDW
jgi:TolB protein